jgi:WD40 repeat protein
MFPQIPGRIAQTLALLFFLGPPVYVQETGFLPGPHRGAVNVLIEDGERIVSAGEDGFLELWSVPGGGALERFQISVLPLKLMAKRPGKSQVCVWESDGFAENRVSVWDYDEKKRIFVLPSRDPVRFIGYSARGNFIFIVHSGRAGIVFINAETGENLLPPEIPGAPVFAATGRSERSLLSCLADGSLSYWNLETGDEIQTLAAPSGLSSLVLFGGGRFLAGIDEGGLVILDAVSAKVLTRSSRIKKGSFISAVPHDRELRCLVSGIPAGGEKQTFELFVWKGPDPSLPSGSSGPGTLVPRGRFNEESVSSFLALDSGGNASYPTAVFGTGEGKAGLVYENGGTGIFACADRQSRI